MRIVPIFHSGIDKCVHMSLQTGSLVPRNSVVFGFRDIIEKECFIFIITVSPYRNHRIDLGYARYAKFVLDRGHRCRRRIDLDFLEIYLVVEFRRSVRIACKDQKIIFVVGNKASERNIRNIRIKIFGNILVISIVNRLNDFGIRFGVGKILLKLHHNGKSLTLLCRDYSRISDIGNDFGGYRIRIFRRFARPNSFYRSLRNTGSVIGHTDCEGIISSLRQKIFKRGIGSFAANSHFSNEFRQRVSRILLGFFPLCKIVLDKSR